MFGDLISAGAKIIGGKMAADSQEKMNRENIQNQIMFAQHGVRWKVADALAAGVHPLAALGASTQSFSNVAGSTAYGDGMSAAGQDIGRAVNATMSAPERSTAAGKAAEALALEKGSLENELLKTQIASQAQKLNQAGGNPPMPIGHKYGIDGQAATVDDSPIPQKKKWDEMPKLKMGGKPVMTDPQTANAESFEDRYGDDGPVSWLNQAGIFWNDLKHNINKGNLTKSDFLKTIANNLKWIDENTSIYNRRRTPRSNSSGW